MKETSSRAAFALISAVDTTHPELSSSDIFQTNIYWPSFPLNLS